MRLISREIASANAVELYVTATPESTAEPAAEVQRIFVAIRAEAERRGGRICRLRAFVPEHGIEDYRRACPMDVGCTWLHAGQGALGGVQAHIIVAPLEWTALTDKSGAPAGWACTDGRTSWAFAHGLYLPASSDHAADTRQAFATAESLLLQAGMGLQDVARTWFFLPGILSWYDRFNVGRNQAFRERGMLGTGPSILPAVPASTGIGVSPHGDCRLAMEFFAVRGQDGCLTRRLSAGRQHSAYDYGVAFARATEATTPAGRTVFVSGTAAIDEKGKSCRGGDVAGQIRMTLDNVLAVLGDAKCPANDVVQAIAYCKTPAVATSFMNDLSGTPDWPWVICIGDVCREELLFEAEVTAATGSHISA